MYLLIHAAKEHKRGSELLAFDQNGSNVTHAGRWKHGPVFSIWDIVKFQNEGGKWKTGHVAFVFTREQSELIKRGISK